MRLIDADKLYPDRMTTKGGVAISQSQIANAPTVEVEKCGDCISRAAAIDAVWKPIVKPNEMIFDALKQAQQNEIEALPSVGPEKCGDSVSRRAIIGKCEDTAKATSESGEINSGFIMGLDFIADYAKHLPSVDSESKWIPVSERLPEDRREVLVTAYWHETYQVMMASYYGDGLWWCVPFNNCGEHMQRLQPKAWMPLPEPYRADMREVQEGRNK